MTAWDLSNVQGDSVKTPENCGKTESTAVYNQTAPRVPQWSVRPHKLRHRHCTLADVRLKSIYPYTKRKELVIKGRNIQLCESVYLYLVHVDLRAIRSMLYRANLVFFFWFLLGLANVYLSALESVREC